MPFTLSGKAKSDLTSLARFTEKRWGRNQRNHYLKQLDDTFHLLAEKPDLGRACDEIRPGYRKFPQGSHVIFYIPEQRRVRIIRILHKSVDADIQFLA